MSRRPGTLKVEIIRLREEKIEVTIPIRCPKCKANFVKEEAALIEDQYIASGQTCQIDLDAELVDNYGSSDDFPEAQYVVGYRCYCGHVLASTEGSDAIETVAPDAVHGPRAVGATGTLCGNPGPVAEHAGGITCAVCRQAMVEAVAS